MWDSRQLLPRMAWADARKTVPWWYRVGMTPIGSETYVFLGGVQDKSLQLVEAIVDSRPSTLLHNWFVTLQMNQKEDRMDRLVDCHQAVGSV